MILEAELGQGAHSIVYRARQDGRAVAVKIARRAGRESRWFRREAVALARVAHRGVPAVFEVGETEGRAFLVMELVEGETLADRRARGPLTLAETLELGIQLARIAQAVHGRGLVHRDITPTNIVLQDRGVVRLVDFGLAAHLGPMLEVVGAAGTRKYAAPEQLEGTRLIDGRADLYAIGRVLRECVAAKVPESLAAILGHLLSRGPEARYPSAAVLVEDLERVVRGAPPLGPARPHGWGGWGGWRQPPPRPTVGRAEEMARLTAAWDHVGRGEGSVWLLEGPAGSGKSHLLHGLAGATGSGPLLRAEGGSSAPLAAVHQLLEHYVDHVQARVHRGDHDLADRLRGLVAGPLGTVVERLSPRLATWLDAPDLAPEGGQDAFVEAAAQLIRELIRVCGPVLVCVDDLQWIDGPSLEILLRVALGAAASPVLLVVAARTESRDRPGPQRFIRVLGSQRLEVLPLPPLRAREIRDLVGSSLGEMPVHPGLVPRIVGLSDGTPLSVLEVLGALLDGGALTPRAGRWEFDASTAEAMPLPTGATDLLERRLAELPAATMRVLQVGAMLGRQFDAALVARVVGGRAEDVSLGLVHVGRLRLIELDPEGRPRFVHDSVRDALRVGLDPQQLRDLHHQVAEVLDQMRVQDPDRQLEIAHHYAQGHPDRAPRRVYEVTRAAAQESARRLDHETAGALFKVAWTCAELGNIELESGFFKAVGESRLRVGALDDGLEALERALVLAEGTERAFVLGRIAWAHQMNSDPERAWMALEQAFGLLGVAVPRGSAMQVLGALLVRMGNSLVPGDPVRSRGVARERLVTLCELHYQNARLSIENQKPFRAVHSALAILRAGRHLGPSSTLARGYAHYGSFMMALGRRRASEQYLDRALEMAGDLGDPAATAHARQNEYVAACYRGELDRALELCNVCLETYGPWMEVTEYCLVAANSRLLEALCGRPRAALDWMRRAIARVQRAKVSPAALTELLAPSLEASRAALGQAETMEPYLGAESAHARVTSKGAYRLASWGPRALFLLETGRIGSELDALVAEFAAENHNPRTVHPIIAEYYIAIAHARVQQALALPPGAGRNALRIVDAAVADVRKSAKIGLFRAHARVLAGHAAFLRGKHAPARKLFAQAAAMGEAESAPWVQSSAARGEARLLLAEGKPELGRARAQVAAELARAHGALPRLARIQKEFELSARVGSLPSPTSESATSVRGRQLRALANVVRTAGRNQRLEPQAREVLDELVRAVGASRGLLSFEANEDGGSRILTGRTAEGADWIPTDPAYFDVMKRLAQSGDPGGSSAGETMGVVDSEYGVGSSGSLAFPLCLHDAVMGAVYMERATGEEPFSSDDHEIAAALLPQIPLTLELARLLEEREHLHDALQQGKKMEAMGRLASGVVHDINNMLSAIMNSVAVFEGGSEAARAAGLQTLRGATQRVADLTHQLLVFSRQQVLQESVVDANDLVMELESMIERMVGDDIRIVIRTGPSPAMIRTDIASLEQAILNLAINARDAMSGGGTLTLEVGREDLDASWRSRGASRTGPHVRIRVQDDGEGMRPKVVERAFEPFFTTKEPGRGTGMGLATIHGFVTQAGGCIDLHTEIGVGTTFTLYLPESRTKIERRKKPPPAARPGADAARILVVDDEPMVRVTLEAALEVHGYDIITAEDGGQALGLLSSERPVDLIITDIWMPQMTGVELARQVAAAGMQTPVLFLSGFTDEELVSRRLLSEGSEFLKKPFVVADLVERVDALLHP